MAEDGFGQSFSDDLRFAWRLRGLRRRVIDWRKPNPAEAQAIEADELLARFGDDTIAVAQIDGRYLTIRERFWSGWPDPSTYALFAREADGRIWCGADFDHWPRRWTIEGEPPR